MPGNVPGPIIFGLVFDVACVVWQTTCEGEEGSCWIYDSQFVAEGIFIACLVVKGVSTLSFLLAYCLYKPPDQEEILVKETTVKTDLSNADVMNSIGDVTNSAGDVTASLSYSYDNTAVDVAQNTYL